MLRYPCAVKKILFILYHPMNRETYNRDGRGRGLPVSQHGGLSNFLVVSATLGRAETTCFGRCENVRSAEGGGVGGG